MYIVIFVPIFIWYHLQKVKFMNAIINYQTSRKLMNIKLPVFNNVIFFYRNLKNSFFYFISKKEIKLVFFSIFIQSFKCIVYKRLHFYMLKINFFILSHSLLKGQYGYFYWHTIRYDIWTK